MFRTSLGTASLLGFLACAAKTATPEPAAAKAPLSAPPLSDAPPQSKDDPAPGVPTPSPRASIRTGHITATGTVPVEVIGRFVRKDMAGLQACYDMGLARDARLAGGVAVTLAIAETGAVTDTNLGATELHDPAVSACLVKELRAITFPKPPDGGAVTAAVPLVLGAASGAK